MYKKMLIVNLGGIGDILLSSISLKSMQLNTDSNLKVDMLVAKRAEIFVRNLGVCERVFSVDLDYGGTIKFLNFFKTCKTLFLLRKNKYDLLVNMRTIVSKLSAWKLKFLLLIIKANKNAGRNTDGLGLFFDYCIEETLIGKKHEMDYDRELMNLLGYSSLSEESKLMLSLKQSIKVDALLRQCNKKKLIVVHPGGMESRRWPVNRYIELLSRLDYTQVQVCLTGSSIEKELCDLILESVDADLYNFCSELDIYELSYLISKSDLFVCGDTGPMHIAAALGKEQIALLGPGDLVRYDPRKINKHAEVIYYGADCGPCTIKICKHQSCLKKISVDEVYAKIKEMIKI